jgi:hypothetical protein
MDLMPRLRVLLAILVLLAGTVLAAGCARTDQPGASGQGATTVTAPPATVPPATSAPPATHPEPSKTTSAPLLVWPSTTAVDVTHPVQVPPVPVLDHVRVGRHPGYDRIVFEFAGPIPSYQVQPATALSEDASGEPVWPGHHNLLSIRLDPAQAHTNAGHSTLNAAEERGAPALPVLRQYRLTGDFEGVVSYGLRLGLGTPNLRVTELARPNRLVVDIAHQRLARVQVSFLHVPNYQAGRQPEIVTVPRAVTPSRAAQGALDAIFAGPTPGERARGLATVRSGATGATVLRISDGVAHVRLAGAPASHGAAFTVANLIMPTLKRLATVAHVKLYDPNGHTQYPTGHRDSVPASLEP